MKTRKLICFALAAVMMLCAVPALAAGNSGWGTTPQYVPESALEMTLSSNMLTLANTTLSITFTNKSKLTNYSFGDSFSLEVARDGRWVPAANYSGNYPYWGYTLAPGKSVSVNLSLAGYDLSKGALYRLGKSVYDERCKISETVYAEFYYDKNYGSGWSGGWSGPSTPSNPSTPNYGYYEYRYATERVNVRTGPSTKYSVIGVLEAGEQVKLIGYSGKWSQVIYRGQVAYVFTKYLGKNAPSYPSVPTPPSQGWGTRLYTTTNLNLRKGPGTKYGIIGTLRVGTAVTFVEKSGNWSKVVCGDYTGYVFTKYLTSTAPMGYAPGYGWTNGYYYPGYSGSTTPPSGYVPGMGLFVPGTSSGYGWR